MQTKMEILLTTEIPDMTRRLGPDSTFKVPPSSHGLPFGATTEGNSAITTRNSFRFLGNEGDSSKRTVSLSGTVGFQLNSPTGRLFYSRKPWEFPLCPL